MWWSAVGCVQLWLALVGPAQLWNPVRSDPVNDPGKKWRHLIHAVVNRRECDAGWRFSSRRRWGSGQSGLRQRPRVRVGQFVVC